jgi:hypothetical protein
VSSDRANTLQYVETKNFSLEQIDAIFEGKNVPPASMVDDNSPSVKGGFSQKNGEAVEEVENFR